MKFSLSSFYQIFAPSGDGFGEAIVVVSLVAVIVLAAVNRLSDSFAMSLTAIGGLGVVHDNCSVWLARKLEKKDQKADDGQ